MANKQVDYTVAVAGTLALLGGLVALGMLPQVYGGYDLAKSFAISSGVGGTILLFTRANLM